MPIADGRERNRLPIAAKNFRTFDLTLRESSAVLLPANTTNQELLDLADRLGASLYLLIKRAQ